MTTRPLVLVVDDQPHIRLPLQYMLQSMVNCDVLVAVDGMEGVELAVQRRPDLVLLDIMMPRLDGYGAAQAIRQQWNTAPVHNGVIWFLTARGLMVDQDRTQTCGAQRVIHKPFNPQQIVDEIRQVLAARAA